MLFFMRSPLYLGSVLLLTWLCGNFAVLPPRGMLPNADRMKEIIHSGLFPDKPRNVSFVEYFRNFTEVNEDLKKVLERLEFNVLDLENLQNVINLAEELRRLKELKMAAVRASRMKTNNSSGARRQFIDKEIEDAHISRDLYNPQQNPESWNLDTRRKLLQFMAHTAYSSRYEISKTNRLRRIYMNSTVFQIGLMYGNTLELRATAGSLYSTMAKMPLTVSTLWYIFHYHKLLNIAYDMASNMEFIFLLNDRLQEGAYHFPYVQGKNGSVSLPFDSREATSEDPENVYRRKKKKKK
ncbi:uncharacterized protein LOC125231573 [Leguminivora glycinivorella]|uniref:uncharacterized protein LOC125231573 n=1 Tax=Leguminivora glycinivorella TaxID=1035111 RepID=UPI00200F7285|nr:uncharacterized protein LOC125231573 [Leguminivora glycinivorella]